MDEGGSCEEVDGVVQGLTLAGTWLLALLTLPLSCPLLVETTICVRLTINTGFSSAALALRGAATALLLQGSIDWILFRTQLLHGNMGLPASLAAQL